MCTYPCSQEGFSIVSYKWLNKFCIYNIKEKAHHNAKEQQFSCTAKYSTNVKFNVGKVQMSVTFLYPNARQISLNFLFDVRIQSYLLKEHYWKMKKKPQPSPHLNISSCILCQLLALSHPCQPNLEPNGSDPIHCGCLRSPDQVSKKKGQKSGDLLKIVENNSSHEWHLIFLPALAPHQRRAKITSDTSPQTFLSSSKRCGASCHPLSFSFGMPFPFISKELSVLLAFEIKLRPDLIELSRCLQSLPVCYSLSLYQMRFSVIYNKGMEIKLRHQQH